MKIKTGLMAILPIVVGSYALDAGAMGRSYDFSADSPGFSQWDLTLSGNQNYYNVSLFDRPDLTANFIEANPAITGQFSYNTSTPAREPVGDTYAFYFGDTALSVDLTSESGASGRFDLVDPYATVQNSSGGTSQHFGVRGYRGTTPPITLNGDDLNNGCGLECDGEGVFSQLELPIDEMRQNHPDIFNNVEQVVVDVFSFGSSYSLGTVGFSLFSSPSEGLLPTDNSLPDHLPALSSMSGDRLSLEFESDGRIGLEVDFVSFIDDGAFASEQEMYDKQNEINRFVEDLYPDLQLAVSYDVTGMVELPEGATPHNPILPDPEATPEEGFEFTFEASADDFAFIDPEVAVGYDYEILEGEVDFLAVLLPEGVGDNLYDLFLKNDETGEFVDTGINITGGVAYSFEEGLSLFRILGIETDENLDPDDPFAFVTGLKFSGNGAVSMSQTPITQTVVPVPPSVLLFMSGLAGLFFRSRKA